jgi:hypothetical protein
MMLAILRSLGMFVADMFKSRRLLEAENLFLRHELSIALRRASPRVQLRGSDRALLVWMNPDLAQAPCHRRSPQGEERKARAGVDPHARHNGSSWHNSDKPIAAKGSLTDAGRDSLTVTPRWSHRRHPGDRQAHAGLVSADNG